MKIGLIIGILLAGFETSSARAFDIPETIGEIIGGGVGGVIGAFFPPMEGFTVGASGAAGAVAGKFIGPVVADHPTESLQLVAALAVMPTPFSILTLVPIPAPTLPLPLRIATKLFFW